MAEADEQSSTDLLSILYEEEKDNEGKRDGTSEFAANHQQEPLFHLTSVGATVVIRQLPSQGLSFQLWPAASSLVSLLDANPDALGLPSLPDSPLRILELGSGTGLVGIAAAAALGACVTLTDLPHVLPNLQFNADANSTAVAARGGGIVVRPLRWGEDGDAFALGGRTDVAAFDAVLASDVVYHDHLIDPLLKTLGFFVRGKVGFVMAHLRRWKKRDAVFFRKARKVFDVKTLHTDSPLPGNRNGVAIYHFAARS